MGRSRSPVGRGRGNPFKPGNKTKSQWKPGQSGHPEGRPKTSAEVVLFARERSIPALKVLEETMLDKKVPPGVRVTSACALLDRAWGRPHQAITVADDLAQLSDAELIAEMKRAIDEAEVKAAAKKEPPPT